MVKLRILHISTRLILGGSQENTVLSCEGQSRAGHEVHLAYGPIYGPEGSMLERVETFNAGSENPILTHEVPDLIREVNPARDRKCLRQLKALIEDIQPDIVHTHSSKAGILGRKAGWAVARGHSMGVLHTIHGPPFMPSEGGLAQRMRIGLKNFMYTLAERHAAKRCHTIISVADAMTEQFLARGIGRAGQYITVRSGMETRAFLEAAAGESREAMRREFGIGERDFVIGTVARLAEHKGHDDVLDAIGDDLRERPAWKLLWVGDGWWRERLETRVRAMGLEEQVVLTGLVPPERVAALMRAMDVLAHPSAREGLPRTVPQALLSGVLPIAYDVDGTREACIEMETGRLVAAGDVEGLRDAIRWAAKNRDEAQAMVERGREWCSREFDAQVMVDRLDEVYRDALTQAGGERRADSLASGG